MKRLAFFRPLFSVLLLLCMMQTVTMPAVRAAERINTVSITIRDAGSLTAGEPIGTLSVTSDSSAYYISDARFLNDHELWQKNERPRVRIELYAEEDYRFSYTTKSHFSLSGFGAVFSSAQIMDNGSYMELDLYLNRVSGDYTSSDTNVLLDWDDNTAVWGNLYGTDSCEVRLYRWNSNGTSSSVVITRKTTKGEFDFTNWLTKSGSYSFRVRPVDAGYDTSELWSEHSPKLYVDSDDARDNQDEREFSSSSWDDTDGPGESTPGSSSSHSTSYGPGHESADAGGPGSSADGIWEKDNIGWWYRYYRGGWPFSSWQMIQGQWYYFNAQGYLQTGWIFLDGNWYYSYPNGVMATGWQKVGPCWYYLANSGIMATGWNLIDGAWYYLDPLSGAMWAGQITPDGHYVNADGMRLY